MTRTHCKRGHELAEVGVYEFSRANGSKIRICRLCKQQQSIEANRRSRAAQDTAAEESARSHRILHLIDAKERAAMHWEREALQLEIDRLRDGGDV